MTLLFLSGFFTTQGLVSNLTLGANTLDNWIMYSLSIDEAISQGLLGETKPREAPQPATLSLPTFYKGTFIIPDGIPDLPQDTYIKLPKWRKVMWKPLAAAHIYYKTRMILSKDVL